MWYLRRICNLKNTIYYCNSYDFDFSFILNTKNEFFRHFKRIDANEFICRRKIKTILILVTFVKNGFWFSFFFSFSMHFLSIDYTTHKSFGDSLLVLLFFAKNLHFQIPDFRIPEGSCTVIADGVNFTVLSYWLIARAIMSSHCSSSKFIKLMQFYSLTSRN